MKGLVVLFLAVSLFGIGWGYMDKDSKRSVKSVARKNIFPIAMAVVLVAVAIFVSTNTILRLV